ncbi:dentin sialophosphoprotein-like [Protopterus annectens]|uniref:dentin sialophosphoprotein-like n=1 Tax=Protopterus annectens TaxID=7888 RepID=UPI001CF99918|nr:dentin sialophosphoprotein-like [Protopterus annectens]XP_043940628.1 dentin sialophosphoprotein-like [Protopterus annectens]
MAKTEQEFTALSVHEHEDLCTEVGHHPNKSKECMRGEIQSYLNQEVQSADSLCTNTEGEAVSIASDEEEYSSDETEDSSDEEGEAEFFPDYEYEYNEDTERDNVSQEEEITEYKGSELLTEHFSEGQNSSEDKKDHADVDDCSFLVEADEEVIILQASSEVHTESNECTDKPQYPFMTADEELEGQSLTNDHLNEEVNGDLDVSTKEDTADTEISIIGTPEDASPGTEHSETSDSEYDPTGDIMIVSEDSAEDTLTGNTLDVYEDYTEDTLPSEEAEKTTDESIAVALETVSYSDESEVPRLSLATSAMDSSSSTIANDVQENAEKQLTETSDMINEDNDLSLGDPLSDPIKLKEEKDDSVKGHNLEAGQSYCVAQHEKVRQSSAEQSNHGITKEANNKDYAGRQESGNKDLHCQPGNFDKANKDMENEDDEQAMQERITQI